MGLISDDFNVFHSEDQLGIFWSQWGWGGRNKEKNKKENCRDSSYSREGKTTISMRYFSNNGLKDTFRIKV